ncbi:MAG TPA: hypothetical protein VMF30_17690 [Pirellulales bacterium]|nr:hypothetical protein [Pirellulales bacterium]
MILSKFDILPLSHRTPGHAPTSIAPVARRRAGRSASAVAHVVVSAAQAVADPVPSTV